ncbi:MAG TPA: hypothetical protein ENN41_07530 [Sediminispirochaeta sp.]|nr:hypothetical protein [Sediminispirochaeta sp.]
MFKLVFELKQTSENVLKLRLHWGFRLVFLVLLGIVVASVFVGRAEGTSFRLVPAVLVLIFVLLGLYQEQWIFNRDTGTISHDHGLLPISKTRMYKRETVDHIEISSFRKGEAPMSAQKGQKKFFQKDLLRLSLVLGDAGRKDIEISEEKNKATLERRAASIADFMNLSYHSEL